MDDAIQYYSNLKKEMCIALNKLSKTTSQEIINGLNKQLAYYRNAEGYSQRNLTPTLTLGKMYELLDKMAAYYVVKQGNNNLAWKETWINTFSKQKKDYSGKLRELAKTSEKIQKQLNLEIDQMQLWQNMKSIVLKSPYITTDSVAFFDQMRGFLRRAILYHMSDKISEFNNLNFSLEDYFSSNYSTITNKSSPYADYLRTSQGYLQEGAVCDAAIKFFEQAFGKGIQVRISGADTNSKGVMGKEDITIVLPSNCSVVGSMTTNLSYGIQSKSWSISSKDFEKLGNSKSININTYHISNTASSSFRKELTGTPAEFWWHAGLQAASQNITDILDKKNVMYLTGSEIFWTSNFLLQLKKINWVIAYSMTSKHKRNNTENLRTDTVRTVSNSVYFRPHNDA